MKTKIDPNYRPSDRVYELLEAREPRFFGNHEFIDHCIPEFILYWEETGEKKASWGATFINRVMRLWENNRHQRFDSPAVGFEAVTDLMKSTNPVDHVKRRFKVPTQEDSIAKFKEIEERMR